MISLSSFQSCDCDFLAKGAITQKRKKASAFMGQKPTNPLAY
jgi:hypothetical protein